MTCRSAQDDLKAYADGELPPLRRLAVRRHLSGCAACREEVQTMETLQNELRIGDDQETLAPELRARILGEAAALGAGEQQQPRPTPRRPWLSGPALACGAAAVVLVCFVLFPMFSRSREQARPFAPMADKAPAPLAQPATVAAPAPASAAAPMMQKQEKAQSAPTAAASIPLAAPGAVSDDAPDASLRRVHKEASITVAVANPEIQSDAVAQMVKAAGGYVADNTLSTGDGGLRSAQMTLRVPEPQFETILGQITKLGDVRAKNIMGEDITGQVSDAVQAESVLEAEAQQSQARLNALGTKAKWQDDTQARDLRIQLAQARARLQLLQKMAALSTLSVTLDEKPKPVPPVSSGFSSQITGTTHAAMGSLASSAGALLTLLIWAAAYAPLWVPAALVVRHFRRLSQQRKAPDLP